MNTHGESNRSGSSMKRNGWRTPAAEISEDKEAFYVYLDMPGVTQENLEVTYENGSIVVSGRQSELCVEGCKLGVHEYNTGDFRRSFAVSEHVNSEGIKASLRNGELKLILPKSETIRPRRIAISAQ